MDLLHAIAQSPTNSFLIWLGVIAGAAIAGFFGGLHSLRRARLLEDTPTALVRSASQGYVELHGHARQMPGPPIIAPLSKKPCCWWRFTVESRDANSQKNGWRVVERETSGELFHLEDESGLCVVNPLGAQVVPSHRDVWYGPLPRPPWGPARGEGFFHGATGKFRYKEERIELHSLLYATGLFRTHRGGEASSDPQAQVRDLVVAWKKDARRMRGFDTNQDGHIDAVEWNAALKMARAEVQAATDAEMPGEDVFVLAKPTDRRPYLLSTQPQEQLVRRYRWGGMALLFLFGGSGIVTLMLIQLRMAMP